MKGVGFDFDHTLGIDKKLERRALLDILDDEELQDDQDAKSCALLVDECLKVYRNGDEMLDSALTDLFARCLVYGYDPAELIVRFRERAVELAPEHIEPLPGVREVLARLTDAGIRTAILTNGWSPLQEKKAELIGYHGPVLVSDDLGVRKPDSRAFEALSKTLELPVTEILYVGDSPVADIGGALKYGMKAAWYNWENQVYPENLPAPTWTIRSLSEIIDLILSSSSRR